MHLSNAADFSAAIFFFSPKFFASFFEKEDTFFPEIDINGLFAPL